MKDPQEQFETPGEDVRGAISFSLGESFELGAELSETTQTERRTIASLSAKISIEHMTKLLSRILNFFQRS